MYSTEFILKLDLTRLWIGLLMGCWAQQGSDCFWAKAVNDLAYRTPSRYSALDHSSASGFKVITSTFAFLAFKSHYLLDSNSLEILFFRTVNCFWECSLDFLANGGSIEDKHEENLIIMKRDYFY